MNETSAAAMASAPPEGGDRPARRRRGLLASWRDTWRRRATAGDRGDVVLGQRRIYIVPTRAGLGFGLLVLVLLVGSINYSLGLGFGLTFLAGACAIVDMVATWRNLAGLTLRPGRAPDAFAGAEAQFELHVANTSALERYAIRIDVERDGVARHALDVAPGAGASVVLAVPARTRGWLAAPRVRVATSFPLGLFRAWSWWQPDSRALVYPEPEVDAPPLPSSGRPGADGGGQAGSDDFAGVRSYQAGDPLRRLAWRQIARLAPELGGQLVTKQFEGGSADELLLDFGALPARLDLELRLSRMARWVLEAEQRALPYAMRLGHREVDAALGAAHQAACLRALALYDHGGHPDHAGHPSHPEAP